MNSYNLYYKLFLADALIPSPQTKYRNMINLIDQVNNELNQPPYSVKNSTYLMFIYDLLKEVCMDMTKLNVMEIQGHIRNAYVAFTILTQIDDFQDVNEIFGHVHALYMMIKSIRLDILTADVQKMFNELIEQQNKKEALMPKLEQQPQEVEEENNHQIDQTLLEKKAEITQMRIEANQKNIEKWHDQNNVLKQQFLEVQPLLAQSLEKIMTFSNEITEQYVIQFASSQIQLFNLIADSYDYHCQLALNSDNEDYKNAILNYEDFLEVIVDNLAMFGIEEIHSETNVPFDGKYHEVINQQQFSPKETVVKESARSGFKYRDIILQKEKISI